MLKEKFQQIMQKHIDILDTLQEQKIFGLFFNTKQNSVEIYEECDQCYSMNLTKQNCLDIANLFNELSKIID